MPAGVRGGVVYGACLPRLTGTGAVTLCHPLAATATCRRTAVPRKARNSRHQLWMSFARLSYQTRPSRAGLRVLPRCLPPLHIYFHTFASSRDSHQLSHPPTPATTTTPTQTQNRQNRTRRARGRLALGFIPFLYALTFEDAVLLSASLFSLFLSSVWPPASGVFGEPNVLWLALTPSHSSLIASVATLAFFRELTMITI